MEGKGGRGEVQLGLDWAEVDAYYCYVGVFVGWMRLEVRYVKGEVGGIPKSEAQIPVPHPASRTRFRGLF